MKLGLEREAKKSCASIRVGQKVARRLVLSLWVTRTTSGVEAGTASSASRRQSWRPFRISESVAST